MAAKGLWVRVYTEITRDRKLRRHPAATRWAWLTILCMAKESPVPGVLLLSESVPVTLEDIADEAAITVAEAEAAVATFLNQAMLEEDGGLYRLIHWDERQFESDSSAERTRNYRERQKQKNETSQERHSNVTVTPPETETETEIISSPNGDSSPGLFENDEIEQSEPADRVPYQEIVDIYHQECPSLSKVLSLTAKRRRLIKARWKGSVEPFRLVFSRAEQSEFLSGRKPSKDHPGWAADLEFILKEDHWAKIIEGYYNNRGAPAIQSAPVKIPRAFASLMEAQARRREAVNRDTG